MYRPWTNRRIGIELEVLETARNGDDVSDRMIRRAIRDRLGDDAVSTRSGYFHSDGSLWDVKSDSSCGWEVVSPAFMLDDEGHNEQVKAVCDILHNGFRMAVDHSCGYHVHVECRDYSWQDLRKLVILWARYEPFFFEMVDGSRCSNSYCQAAHREEWEGSASERWFSTQQALEAQTLAEFQRAMQQNDRYGALNVENWWLHKRIEVRLHHGTTSYEVVRQWAMLIASLVARVKHPTMPDIKNVVNWHGMGGFDTRYIGKVLGLVKSKMVPEVPEVSEALVQWIDLRRARRRPQPRSSQQRVRVSQVSGETTITECRCEARIGGRRRLGAPVTSDDPNLWLRWNEVDQCPNEQVPGRRVCREHLSDYDMGRTFRDTRPVVQPEPVRDLGLSEQELAALNEPVTQVRDARAIVDALLRPPFTL